MGRQVSEASDGMGWIGVLEVMAGKESTGLGAKRSKRPNNFAAPHTKTQLLGYRFCLGYHNLFMNIRLPPKAVGKKIKADWPEGVKFYAAGQKNIAGNITMNKTQIKKAYINASQKLGTMLVAPSARQVQLMLFGIGAVLLVSGLTVEAVAYQERSTYNDDRISEAADVILTYINGAFGALVMIACGVAAILSSAFGQYRAAMGLMVVAVGSFILRSLVNTWFNTAGMKNDVEWAGQQR